MNYVKQIAEMLGVEIGEKFRIKGHPDIGTFWFVEDESVGMKALYQFWSGDEFYDNFDSPNDILELLLTGFYEVEKVPWKPKDHEDYFYFSIFNGCGQIRKFYIDETLDMMNYKAGNCFKTIEEAETKGKELMEQIRKEYEEA